LLRNACWQQSHLDKVRLTNQLISGSDHDCTETCCGVGSRPVKLVSAKVDQLKIQYTAVWEPVVAITVGAGGKAAVDAPSVSWRMVKE
jgi:hypothetical protein